MGRRRAFGYNTFKVNGTIHFRCRIVCSILNLVVCFMCRGGKYKEEDAKFVMIQIL